MIIPIIFRYLAFPDNAIRSLYVTDRVMMNIPCLEDLPVQTAFHRMSTHHPDKISNTIMVNKETGEFWMAYPGATSSAGKIGLPEYLFSNSLPSLSRLKLPYHKNYGLCRPNLSEQPDEIYLSDLLATGKTPGGDTHAYRELAIQDIAKRTQQYGFYQGRLVAKTKPPTIRVFLLKSNGLARIKFYLGRYVPEPDGAETAHDFRYDQMEEAVAFAKKTDPNPLQGKDKIQVVNPMPDIKVAP